MLTSISRNIFRALHEGKWLYIEYQNKGSLKTKYWIAIKGINIEYKSLLVIGLHLGDLSTKELTIYIDKILSSYIIEGTYYKTNFSLLNDIELFPQKYNDIFPNAINLKTLDYLVDCNKLADLPKLNTEYELVKRLDSSKITNKTYQLDEEQFRYFINSFKKTAERKNDNNTSSILQLALNVLSIHMPKGLYVLAYREVRLDVEKKTLVAGNKIKICSEFCITKNENEKDSHLSIQNFLDNDELILLDDFELNAELIKDTITEKLLKRKNCSVDDMPYFLCIQRNINVNLEKEYVECKTGKKVRDIPLGKMALNAVKEYLAKARDIMVKSDKEKALFVNMNGKRLTRQGFWKIIKYYQEQAHIDKDITPHTLRHSFATHLLQNGAELKAIQTMLGHSDISSTQVYMQFQNDGLNNIYKKAHPRA